MILSFRQLYTNITYMLNTTFLPINPTRWTFTAHLNSSISYRLAVWSHSSSVFSVCPLGVHPMQEEKPKHPVIANMFHHGFCSVASTGDYDLQLRAHLPDIWRIKNETPVWALEAEIGVELNMTLSPLYQDPFITSFSVGATYTSPHNLFQSTRSIVLAHNVALNMIHTGNFINDYTIAMHDPLTHA